MGEPRGIGGYGRNSLRGYLSIKGVCLTPTGPAYPANAWVHRSTGSLGSLIGAWCVRSRVFVPSVICFSTTQDRHPVAVNVAVKPS